MISSLPVENDPGTGKCERRGNLLLESTIQFCNDCKHRYSNESEIFTKLFYSLIGDTTIATKKTISAHLARNPRTPRPIAYYLAMESIEIAAPFLLISPALWERDLLQLIEKLETPYLAIIARRSDVSARMAQALVSRGDKLVCQVLLKNPILKLNSVKAPTFPDLPGEQNNSAIPSVSKTGTFNQSGIELLKLADVGEKHVTAEQNIEANDVASQEVTGNFFERLLKHARNGQYRGLAKEIGERIGMQIDDVEKIVRHENSSSFAIFLKGLNVPRSDVSQILLLVNQRTGRNIADFASSIARYDELPIVACIDIMKNLGARSVDIKNVSSAQAERETLLSGAATARRRQIMAVRPTVMFGDQQKTG